MSAIKERILGALTVMSEEDAAKIWHIIKRDFAPLSWEGIEEVEPTEEESAVLDAYERGDENYQPYISHSQLKNNLNLI